MKPDYSKVFGRAILVCWVVIISCWAISLFRPEWFLIVVENQRIIQAGEFIEGHGWALYLFAVVSSCLSMFQYWLACIGKRWFDSRRDVLICAVTILVSVAVKLWNPTVGFMLDLMWLFTGLPIIMGAKISNTLIMIFGICIYQKAVLTIRSVFVFVVIPSNIAINAVLSIDLIAIYLLLYCNFAMIGGEIHGYFWWPILWQNQRAARGNEGRKAGRSRSYRQASSRVERKISRQLMVRKFRSYAIVFGSMGVVAHLSYHYLEGIILFLAYLALRWTFPETFHARSPRNCTIISTVLFCMLVWFSVPVHTSLVSGVVVALVLSYQLYREWDYRDIREGNEGRERDFKAKCTGAGLSAEMERFAYDWLFVGLHDKEMIIKYQLSGENTLNSRKRRISAKMNSK